MRTNIHYFTFLHCILLVGLFSACDNTTQTRPPVVRAIHAVSDPYPSLPSTVIISVNDTEMEFIRMSPGMFVMGRDEYPLENHFLNSNVDASSSPAFVVTLTKGFYIQKDNMSCAQFKDFLNETDAGLVNRYLNISPANSSRQFGNKNGKIELLCEGNDPIKTVSWEGAYNFGVWLSSLTEMDFRLPSEAEWEYTARGHANAYDVTWNTIGRPAPNAVPSPRTPLGVRGMATGYLGNWVQDHFDDFTSSPKTDPAGPASISSKYEGMEQDVRVLKRPLSSISERIGGYNAQNGTWIYGFRIVLSEDSINDYLNNHPQLQNESKIIIRFSDSPQEYIDPNIE